MAANATAASTTRTQARGRARRRQLTDVAATLFAAEGSRGTGIAAVASEAGVTNATLLYHFGSKDGLLQAVLEERDDAGRAEWDELMALGGLEAIRRLPAVAQRWLRDPAGARLYTVLLAESLSPDAPMHDFFTRRQSAVRRGLREAIERGQASGEIRADVDPRSTAIQITAFMDGLVAEWSLDPERIPVADVLADFCHRLVEAVAVARERKHR